jgi:hypothetical protein
MTKKFGDTSRKALQDILDKKGDKTFVLSDQHARAVKKALEYIDFIERDNERLKGGMEYFREQREKEGDFWAGLMGHLEPQIEMLIEEKIMDRRNYE